MIYVLIGWPAQRLGWAGLLAAAERAKRAVAVASRFSNSSALASVVRVATVHSSSCFVPVDLSVLSEDLGFSREGTIPRGPGVGVAKKGFELMRGVTTPAGCPKTEDELVFGRMM